MGLDWAGAAIGMCQSLPISVLT